MQLSNIEINIIELKSYLRQAPESNARINELIKLYEDRHIKNIKTALTTIASLASTNKNTINSGKPLRLYNQIIDKYGEALPVRRRPIQPIRRRGRPTKQEQQAQRLEQHRLLREEQQRELTAQMEEYGQGDLFIDDEEPEVPEWLKYARKYRRRTAREVHKKTTKHKT